MHSLSSSVSLPLQHECTYVAAPGLQCETMISTLRQRGQGGEVMKRRKRKERGRESWGGVTGEEGKPEQLAALSRTYQGENERGRKKRNANKGSCGRWTGRMEGCKREGGTP